jgi:twitching motility protein PilT
MPERNRKEFAEVNDTDFAHEIPGVARYRANALRDRKGAAAVFRVIPATVVTVEQLSVSQEVQNLCYLTKGLVLVTGPTGSGKSTTLCSLVDLVNRARSDHVITIEDPIEFVHENKGCIITQRQVGVHTGSFKAALRAALREDPDIILVGELRDLETVSIAIETAETGHLVFGTLHTTTAASTIDRLIDQFSADRQEQIRTMLSESLKGVISQVLCKKIGGGRVAAREILLVNQAVSNLIREGKTFQIPSIMQTSKRIGMMTMNDELMGLVEKKLVEPKEAYMKSVDKTSFLAGLKAKGFETGFAEAESGGMGAGAKNAPVGGGKK